MVSDNSAKEELKRAIDIVELIGRYVELRKVGRNYVGRCPFHGDNDPSFNVNREKQSFHCFGCKKGGDVFSFWMDYHGTTFPEAMRDLAEKYGIPYTPSFYSPEEKKKSRARRSLFRINEISAKYFEHTLEDPKKGAPGKTYLDRRKIPPDSRAAYRLGFAADEWDGLLKQLKKAGVDTGLAVDAGVIVRGNGGKLYDRFRGRVIFPLLDQRNQVVGFGGRVLDASVPKYLNTPETPVFHKSDFLYGLPAAAPGIRNSGRVIVVEGYMDCIALQCHGLSEVVATLGTSLSKSHIRKLKGYGSEVFLVFDADEAGKKAAVRSLPLFLNEGVSARVVVLEAGYDPDSYVNAFGLDAFTEHIEHAPGLFDFFIEQQAETGDGSVEQNVRILEAVLPLLSSIENDMQRALYVQRISQHIDVTEQVLWDELEKRPDGRGRQNTVTRRWISPAGGTIEKRFDALHILNLLVHHPETIETLKSYNCTCLIEDAAVRDILVAIFQLYGEEEQCSFDFLHDRLESEEARRHLREAYFEGSRFTGDEVDLALAEIETKIENRRLAESLAGAGHDLEALNRVLELKRLRDTAAGRPPATVQS
ncbi:MAG TPA: DNA primase [Desulfobacteraceae bacterium]|nr:DNA primase [Desulfobacteraceae bacterium]